MKTLSVWFGILASIGVAASFQGIHPRTFFQPAAALMVFGPVLCCLLFAWGPQGSILFLKRLFSGNWNEQDRAIARQLCSVAFICGSIAFLTGTIHVMQNLANTSAIGSGVAVAIVGLLYGFTPTLMFAPMLRENAVANSTNNNARPMMYVAASFAGASLMLSTVLYALSRLT